MTAAPPSSDTVLRVFDTLESPGTPLTTAAVAAEFGGDRPVLEVLETLAETDRIRTKQITDDVRVWWRPVEASRSGESPSGLRDLEAFRSELTDAIHPLEDPIEIQHEAARLLGERLDVDRAHYADIQDDENTSILHADYYRDDVSSIVGEYLLDDYGEHIAERIRDGDTIVVDDLSTVSGLSEAQRELYEALSITAGIAVPLLQENTLTAYLGVTHSTARDWTDTEIAMVEETAEWTWTAVRWAQAQQGWRESEERLQLAANVANIFSWEIDLATGAFEASMGPIDGSHWSMPLSMDQIRQHLLPEHRDGIQTRLERAIAECGEFELEAPYRHPDADEVIWTYSAGVAVADGGETATRLVGITQDITERKQAELKLEEQAELDEFRVELTDALQPLSDATEIQRTATRVLGERLEAGRVLYSELDDAEGKLHIDANYTHGEFPALTGEVPLDTFGDLTRPLRSGETLVIPDVTSSDRVTEEQRADVADLDIRSAVVVPLVKAGRWRANLSVHLDVPRTWTDAEVEMVEETAQRTWAAVERARAEERLRESETALATELAAVRELQELSTQLIRGGDSTSLSDLVLDAAVEIMDADFGSIRLYDTEHEDLELITSRGFDERAEAPRNRATPVFSDTAEEVLRTGQRVVVEDVRESIAETDDEDPSLRTGIRAMQTTPLVTRNGDVLGVFSTHWKTPHDLSERDLGHLDILTRQASDLIEHQRIVNALRESENEFRTIANLVPDLLWSTDPDGSATWCNQRLTEHTGQTLEDVVEDGWLVAVHPEDREQSLERFRTAIERGEPYRQEHRLESTDGDYRWFLSRGEPVRDEDGEITRWFGASTNIHEQRETAVALERLNDATKTLIDAAPADLAASVPDLAAHVLETEWCVLWRYNDRTGELERYGSRAGHEPAVGSARRRTTSSEQIWDVFVNGEIVTLDHQGAPEFPLGDASPRSSLLIPLAGHGIVHAESTRPAAFDDRHVDLAETFSAAVEAAWDRAESEQTRAEQNEELKRLDRLNRLLRQVDQALVSADTVDRVYEQACEQLAESSLYEFAWIGTHGADASTTEPLAWAGVDSEYIEEVSNDEGGSEGGEDPVTAALRTGELQVVADTVTDREFEPWRAATLQRGARSVVSIPLVYDESRYGVLTVYGDYPNPDDRDLEVLAELGRTIAHVIHARETTATTQTDAVVELTLHLTDVGTPLSRLSTRTDGIIEFDGFVPRSDGEADVFFTLSGASTTDLSALETRTLSVERLERLSDRPGESLLRARVREPTLAARLAGQDAVLRELRFENGDTTAVVDLAQTADVRTFLDGLREFYPDLQLFARHPRDRPLKTRRTFVATVRERLTDRQLEILQTAYLSGYFETPRVTTGQEIVKVLDISQPTFSQHLRAAERSLCELLFEAV